MTTIFVETNHNAELVLTHAKNLPHLIHLILLDPPIGSLEALARTSGVKVIQYKKVLVCQQYSKSWAALPFHRISHFLGCWGYQYKKQDCKSIFNYSSIILPQSQKAIKPKKLKSMQLLVANMLMIIFVASKSLGYGLHSLRCSWKRSHNFETGMVISHITM